MRFSACWQAAQPQREVTNDKERRRLFPARVNVLRSSERVSFAKAMKFQERDIAQDPNALAELKKLGCMTTPVIVVDGSVIVGFDTDKIDQALKD
jgi:glutaredoxin